MAPEEFVQGGHREVAEMLMVNRVELTMVDQISHVRHLETSQIAWLQ